MSKKKKKSKKVNPFFGTMRVFGVYLGMFLGMASVLSIYSALQTGDYKNSVFLGIGCLIGFGISILGFTMDKNLKH